MSRDVNSLRADNFRGHHANAHRDDDEDTFGGNVDERWDPYGVPAAHDSEYRQWTTWRANLSLVLGALAALALVASILKFTNTLPKEAVAPVWSKDVLALGLGGGAVAGAIGAVVFFKLHRTQGSTDSRGDRIFGHLEDLDAPRQWTWRGKLAVALGVLAALALVASILKFTNTLPKEAVAPNWNKDILALGLGGGAVAGGIGTCVLGKLQRNQWARVPMIVL